MLAEELHAGKLGGLCSLNKPAGNALSAAAGQAGSDAPSGSHCDLCGTLGLALPAFAVQTLPSVPGMQLAGAFLTFDLNAAITGLPPGRGPPNL